MGFCDENIVKIEISPDYMRVYMALTPREDTSYEFESIKTFLEQNSIKLGINAGKIKAMIDERKYYSMEEIATGRPAENGEDGRFDFLFDTDFVGRPAVEEDGSVDFRSMKMFVAVKQGDVLARYIAPTQGQFGYDVRGTLLSPKKGRALAPLRGRGFDVSDDGATYTARFDGKVEYKYGQLEVSNVYEHHGDLDLTDGNIRFSGDVHIMGNVASGMIVESTGSIEIDGHVGAATIISGADIVIKGGMQGNGKGSIESKGKVSGRYFEETRIRCEGDIETNYLLNCDVYVRGFAKIAGRQGTVIGGMLHAVKGINSANAGNEAGRPTILRVGVSDELLTEYENTKRRTDTLEKEILTLNAGLERLEQVRKTTPTPESQVAFNKLFQTKILKTAEKKQMDVVKNNLFEQVSQAAVSEILIENLLHAGVNIFIGQRIKNVMETSKAVRVRPGGADIVLEGI